MTLTSIPLDDAVGLAKWDAFVSSHPRGTFFHLSGWLRTLAETYGFDPQLHVLADDAAGIRAVVPIIMQRGLIGRRRLSCLPFSDYCWPLGLNEADEALILSRLLEELPAGARCLEIRGPVPGGLGFSSLPYYKRHILRLHPDPNEVLKRIDKHTIAYNIRRGKKAGIEIVEDRSPGGCDEFCRLNALTRKKHGIPPQPKQFFQALARNLSAGAGATILLAVHESRVIGGGVFFRGGKTVLYKYNASDPAALTKFSPNHALTWAAIEKACLDGYEIFDFGRTAPDNEGLMRYKKMWGAEVLDLPYSFYPESSGLLKKGEHSGILDLLKGIWRVLPEPLVSRIGPKIIRYFG